MCLTREKDPPVKAMHFKTVKKNCNHVHQKIPDALFSFVCFPLLHFLFCFCSEGISYVYPSLPCRLQSFVFPPKCSVEAVSGILCSQLRESVLKSNVRPCARLFNLHCRSLQCRNEYRWLFVSK